MKLREQTEKDELERLSQYAAKSVNSLGRDFFEEKCEIRTDFQRDRDRIIHSKALRRLMHKTQVFISPERDHFRTRLTHTMEVSQISRTIARALNMNEDLAEAIAMGHDLGHTPFGHNGERFLDDIHPSGFHHNIQSLRVVEILEKSPSGAQLNLTKEVRDGIRNHTGDTIPKTLEGQIVRISDRIAYINHDIDDAIRAKVISPEDLPNECIEILGNTNSMRINTLVTDLIRTSDGNPVISMSPEISNAMTNLRTFMFENVYLANDVKKDEEMDKLQNIIYSLYDYYLKNPKELPLESREMINEWGINEVVKDHIAGMTDRYALNSYEQIFIPKTWV